MRREYKAKLDNLIKGFQGFIEREYSDRFKNLTQKEDRQLFFLAQTLVQLKQIQKEINDEKVISFPAQKKELVN